MCPGQTLFSCFQMTSDTIQALGNDEIHTPNLKEPAHMCRLFSFLHTEVEAYGRLNGSTVRADLVSTAGNFGTNISTSLE